MRIVALALLLVLAACASQPKPAPVVPAASGPRMDQLMGQTADAATGLLGAASLDRREGPARQLQFAGACVLDLFYYTKPGQATVASHASARLPDGRAVPPGECLGMLMAERERGAG